MNGLMKRKRTDILPLRLGIVFCCALLILAACSDDSVGPAPAGQKTTGQYPADVPVAWYDLALTLTKETPGFSPPVAARAFGYSGVALYEAVVPGMKGYVSLSGTLNALTITTRAEAGADYHWPSAANAALASIIAKLYRAAPAARQADITALEQQFAAQFATEADADVISRSVQFGRAIADEIFTWSITDGGDECFKSNFPDFTMPQGPGMWVPTPPAYQSCLQPRWGDMRPFVTASVASCQPAVPPAYSLDHQSEFYIETAEVYEVSKSLTQEQRLIAEFWSDDPGKTATPPGHSVSVTGQLLRQTNASLAKAAEAFMKIGVGVHDAFVSCWKAKYTHNLIRPVTVIRENIDAGWMPILNTPPFPEYPSGHSVQSGATARILSALFGEQVSFSDRTHEARTDINGTPRVFTSFYDMAQEAAISRLYGGIHYRAAIELGLEQGYAVGAGISALPIK